MEMIPFAPADKKRAFNLNAPEYAIPLSSAASFSWKSYAVPHSGFAGITRFVSVKETNKHCGLMPR